MQKINQRHLTFGALLFAVALLLVTAVIVINSVNRDEHRDFFIGDYTTASGGETKIKLSLHSDGKGIIIYESWTDKGYEYETLARSEVEWDLRDKRLVIVYENLYDVFQYKTDYELNEFGEEGFGTGLLQTFPVHDESWVAGNFLFKLPRKDEK